MELPRVAIWLGLGIVAYLLVMAWNEDYHQQPVADSQQPTEQVAPDSNGETASTKGETPDAGI